MLRRIHLIWLIVPVMVLGLAALGTSGGKIEEFSADQVHMDAKGKVQRTSKVYAAPGKMRMEMASPDGKGRMINIVRQDEGVLWMIFPEKKAYMERPISEPEAENLMKTFKDAQKEEDLGNETVNGFKCKKTRITRTQKFMGREMTIKMTVWKSERLDWPIRSQSDNGSTMELRNSKEGRQKKDLFEAPSGYRKAANMMELMR